MSHDQEPEDVSPHPFTVAPDIDKPDDVIKTVRDVRVRMLNKQLACGVPTDGDVFEATHKNLQELEKSAFAEKKQASEENKLKDDGLMIRAIAAEMLRQRTSSPPSQVEGTIPDPLKDIEGVHQDVPGCDAIGDDSRKYEEFMDQSGHDIDARIRSGELALSEITR